MTVRITTWNLQGRERPDLGGVAAVLDDLASDLVLLQEVQRSQAHRLRDVLGWSTAVWRLKHWPLVIPAEGLAVLAPVPVDAVDAVVLARRWAFWSSHRRIALAVDARVDGAALRVVDAHLGAGVDDVERARQAAIVLDLARSATSSVIGGDLNAAPGSAVLEALGVAGHRDAWATIRGDEDGPTNWRSGPRDGAPVQRLDYVLVPPGIELVDISVPRHGGAGFDRFGALSDHLPVTATIEL